MAENKTHPPRRGRPPLAGRREEILDAAISVVAEHGLEALSLGKLAEQLGFSTYTLSYHFGSREDLMAALAGHFEARLQEEFRLLADQTDSNPSEMVRRYWEAAQKSGEAGSMRLWLELVLLESRNPGRFPEFAERAVMDWKRVVEAAIGDREDAPELAMLVFASVVGFEVLNLALPGDPDLQPALARLGRILDQAINTNAPTAQP